MVIVLSSAGLATSRPISPLRPTAVTGGRVCTAKSTTLSNTGKIKNKQPAKCTRSGRAATGGEGKEAGVRVSVLYETEDLLFVAEDESIAITGTHRLPPTNRVRAPPWPEPQSPEPAPAGRPLFNRRPGSCGPYPSQKHCSKCSVVSLPPTRWQGSEPVGGQSRD